MLAKVLETLDTAHSAGLPVFFLRHLSRLRPLMGTFQLPQAMAGQRVQDPGEVQPWFLRDLRYVGVTLFTTTAGFATALRRR